MSDLAVTYNVLQESVSGTGVGWSLAAQGDAAASRNMAAVMVAKDPSNDLQLLKTDAGGALITTSEGLFNYLDNAGEVAGASGYSTVATVTLVASKTFSQPNLSVSCNRSALFQLMWNNNGSNVLLAEALVGSGQYTFAHSFPQIARTAGTGTQTLFVQGKCLETLSDLHAEVSVQQAQ
jgi:hypothetical protein